jgi:hypothetical protein
MKRILLLCMTALCLTDCATVPEGKVTHVVVFWLKDHGNAAHRAKIIETSEGFRKIPGVLSVKAGPCIPSARPIVDSAISTTRGTKRARSQCSSRW